MKSVNKIYMIVFSIVFLVFGTPANSQELVSGAFYVDKELGADSNDGRAIGEGGSGPWRTIQHAAQTISAGQTVYIREGIYTEPEPIEGSTKYWGIRPANDGAAGDRIRFLAYPGERPVIDMEMKAPCIVLYGRKHIEVSGFELRSCVQAGVWVMSGSGRDNSDIFISNNLIHRIDGGSGQNVAAVRMDDVGNSKIQDNIMHNIKVAGVDNGNAAGVLSYGMYEVTITNNEIHDAYSGIFHKMPDRQGRKGGVFQRNLIHDTTIAFYFNTNETWPEQGIHFNTEIRNNVVYAVDAFLYDNTHQSVGQNQGLKVYNNTIDGGNFGIRGFADVEIYNNIFFKINGIATVYQSEVFTSSVRRAPSIAYTDHNIFYPGFSGALGVYSGNEVKVGSLSEWQSVGYGGTPFTLNVDAPGPDQHSMEINPLFVDQNARNYRLDSASPAAGSGKNGGYMGAYTQEVKQIGPRTSIKTDEVASPKAPELTIE